MWKFNEVDLVNNKMTDYTEYIHPVYEVHCVSSFGALGITFQKELCLYQLLQTFK